MVLYHLGSALLKGNKELGSLTDGRRGLCPLLLSETTIIQFISVYFCGAVVALVETWHNVYTVSGPQKVDIAWLLIGSERS
jgi:hypothetical protein